MSPAIEAIPLPESVPIHLEPGARNIDVAPGQPRRFSQVRVGDSIRVSVGPGFLAQEKTVILGEGTTELRFPVLPLALCPVLGNTDSGSETPRTLLVDLTSSKLRVVWTEGSRTIAKRDIDVEDDLTASFREEWEYYGAHTSDKDPERDLAQLRKSAQTPPARVEEVAKALLEVKRNSLGSGARMTVSAFRLTLCR